MVFGRLRELFRRISIRYSIFIYFTVTALAASVLIGVSLYIRMSDQISDTLEEENQILVNQLNRSVDSWLRNIMKLSDSLYYGVIKNADLSEESIAGEMTLLYDNGKDYVENLALFSREGELLEAVPAARLKPTADVTGDRWFEEALERTENQHFSDPHVQYVFDAGENTYRWVISVTRAVELTQGADTHQGVLLIDVRYDSLEQLFNGVSLGNGGYVYLIGNDGEIIYHPDAQLIYSGHEEENHQAAAGYRDGGYKEEFQGEERLITVKTVGYTGWKIIGVTPTGGMNFDAVKTRLLIVFVVLFVVFLLAIINSYISTKITTPIEQLERTREGRSINRHDYTAAEIDEALERPVVQRLVQMMRWRGEYPAFDERAGCKAVLLQPHLLEVRREYNGYEARLRADLAAVDFCVEAREQGGPWRQVRL